MPKHWRIESVGRVCWVSNRVWSLTLLQSWMSLQSQTSLALNLMTRLSALFMQVYFYTT